MNLRHWQWRVVARCDRCPLRGVTWDGDEQAYLCAKCRESARKVRQHNTLSRLFTRIKEVSQ